MVIKQLLKPFKGKMRILPSFTQLHVVPNLYALLASVEHKRRYFENVLVLAH